MGTREKVEKKDVQETRYARLIYGWLFVILTLIEVAIALWIDDAFIRPYVGDMLVVWVVYFFVRMLYPKQIKYLPLLIFIFATVVEISQYFQLVELLGLGDISVMRMLMGTTFSWIDIICYAVGAMVLVGCEKWARILHANNNVESL